MKRTNNNPGIQYSSESLIKQTAYEIGFSDVGIAHVAPSKESSRIYDRWIAEGKHGEMRYLSGGRDKRHNPGSMVEGAQSVICVAVNYYSEHLQQQNANEDAVDQAVFSLYAQGRDYHVVVGDMLRELDQRLRDLFPDLESAVCVDTQPISERELAIRSGVGWLGKNTMVISLEFGSWIFLGELITNLDLRCDEPLSSLCGSCTRCIDACPTGALDEPFFLDATKCISYLTIEKRGDIPEAHHSAIGRHVFGCDDCQTVCPFNAHAQDSEVFLPADRNPLVDLSLGEMAAMSDSSYRELTKRSAISRCKADGLRRNARIVAKNTETT